jgi:hypothetical protein
MKSPRSRGGFFVAGAARDWPGSSSWRDDIGRWQHPISSVCRTCTLIVERSISSRSTISSALSQQQFEQSLPQEPIRQSHQEEVVPGTCTRTEHQLISHGLILFGKPRRI